MIPPPLLNWATLAVSLFNTILLFWLGLTILLNAERYTWGVWLTSGGLLVGCTFFVSHTAVLAYRVEGIDEGLNFWWSIGWLPVILSPLAWYLAMLWYAGFWRTDNKHKQSTYKKLQTRQQPWVWLMAIWAIGLVGLFIIATPIPDYTEISQLNLEASPSLAGIPVLIVMYPFYLLLCILLSLDALRHRISPGQVMSSVAHGQAWPWLMAATSILLIISLSVSSVIAWVVFNAKQPLIINQAEEMSVILTFFDLIIASLMGMAIVLMGRAIVSYEVFTGRLLPRSGLFRHWRNVVIIAAGYGLVVSWSLTFEIRPVYNLLFITLAVTLFYTLFNWQSYAEQENYMKHLRPFVASQRLYEHLLPTISSSPGEVDILTPFRALCRDVLEVKMAYLVAVGPLAPLVGPPLTYPENTKIPLAALTEITSQFNSPQEICIPLNPISYHKARWAISLWSERGFIGVFLLGDKQSGRLYTQEEIEIARASGERLIDTQASAQIARRLMSLQRERLAQSQVLDRRTRQILHDDVLPTIHTAMLSLSSNTPSAAITDEVMASLSEAHHQISDLLRDMPTQIRPEISKFGLVSALRRLVDNELAPGFDKVIWQIAPEAINLAKTLPPFRAEVLFYAAREVIRNASRHGRGDNKSASLILKLTISWQAGIQVTIEDNGVGLDSVGSSNGNTESNKGSGQGLALHTTMMAVVGGTLAIESIPGKQTRVLLTLPEGVL